MNNSSFRPLEHNISNSLIRVEYTNITTVNVDVLVSSDDTDLSMGGGVSRALLSAGGERIWGEAQAQAPVRLGEIAVTTAGRLNAKHIFHAAVLDYASPNLTTVDLVRRVTKKCLMSCDEMGFKSIAFPALATGAARLSPERSAVAMIIETALHLSGPTNIDLVVIALFQREGLNAQVLPNFYKQVSDFIDMENSVGGLWGALDKLERLYRELKMERAAEKTGHASQEIRHRINAWEQDVLRQEPYDREVLSSRHRAEITEVLTNYTEGNHLLELEQLRQQRGKTRGQHEWEAEYRQYRVAALVEMIAIRRRNVSDLELELTRQGFSVDINRRIERERIEINRLEEELRSLRS